MRPDAQPFPWPPHSDPLDAQRITHARAWLEDRNTEEGQTILAALALAEAVNRGDWIQCSARTVNLTEREETTSELKRRIALCLENNEMILRGAARLEAIVARRGELLRYIATFTGTVEEIRARIAAEIGDGGKEKG